MTKQKQPPNLEYRTNSFGEIEEYDVLTGEVVSSSRQEPEVPFTAKIANRVCDLVSQGQTLIEISKLPNCPDLKTINRWKHYYPLFKDKLVSARKNFAEHLIEQAVIAGRAAAGSHKDEIPGLKTSIDTNIKIAEKYDKEQFGNQTKVVGDVNAPVTFKLVTGIPTLEDIQKEEAIEAQYREVENDGETENDVQQDKLSENGSRSASREDGEDTTSEWED